MGGSLALYGGYIHLNQSNDKGGGVSCDGCVLTTDRDVFGSPTVIEANGAGWSGGGLYVSGIGQPLPVVLRHVELEANTTPADGGGVAIYSAVVEAEGVVLRGNSSTAGGGGVSLAGSGVSWTGTGGLVEFNTAGGDGGGFTITRGTLDLSGLVVEGNEATGDGGGVACRDANCSLTSPTVLDNLAGRWGGGLSAVDCTVVVDGDASVDATFSGNEARRGGGIHLERTLPGAPAAMLGALNLSHNLATTDDGTARGGGLRLEGHDAVLTDVDFVENECAGGGGGLSMGVNPMSADLTCNGCAFQNNRAANGAGVSVVGEPGLIGRALFRSNTTFFGNSVTDAPAESRAIRVVQDAEVELQGGTVSSAGVSIELVSGGSLLWSGAPMWINTAGLPHLAIGADLHVLTGCASGSADTGLPSCLP